MKMPLLRTRTRKIAAALVLLLALGVIGSYRVFSHGTPVDADEAVEIFRRDRARVAREASASTESGGSTGSTRRSTTTAGTARGSDGPVPTPLTLAAGRTAPGWLERPILFRPAEGSYEYETAGEEGITGGYSRDLGGITRRNVVHTGPTTWYDHHIFRDERQSWAHFEQTPVGRHATRSRNLIAFGPIVIDEEFDFDPPALSSWVPWRLQKRWQGSFSGDVYGTYVGETFEHTTLGVGGTPVEVWGDHLFIELHGRVDGTVDVKRWISPRFGTVVAERYVAHVRKGPITYTASWSTRLRSLAPRR